MIELILFIFSILFIASWLIMGFIVVPLKQKKEFNNGICPKCGGIFLPEDMDSGGSTMWCCSNRECDNTIWIDRDRITRRHEEKIRGVVINNKKY